jgi:hypothetical protein
MHLSQMDKPFLDYGIKRLTSPSRREQSAETLWTNILFRGITGVLFEHEVEVLSKDWDG